MNIERIYQHLNWDEAIEYSRFNNCFLPTISQCRDFGIVSTWTCETNEENIHHAYYITISGKAVSLHKITQEKHFCTVDKRGTNNQDVSYKNGDIW